MYGFKFSLFHVVNSVEVIFITGHFRTGVKSHYVYVRAVAMKTDGQDGSYEHSRMHFFLHLIQKLLSI